MMISSGRNILEQYASWTACDGAIIMYTVRWYVYTYVHKYHTSGMDTASNETGMMDKEFDNGLIIITNYTFQSLYSA